MRKKESNTPNISDHKSISPDDGSRAASEQVIEETELAQLTGTTAAGQQTQHKMKPETINHVFKHSINES